MITENFHTHTVFCDGKDTVEEMAREAYKEGFTALGFSGHSYTDFDRSYCMKKEEIPLYFKEVNKVRKEYGDKLRIYCGLEQDIFSNKPQLSFDYLIGSVHYIKIDNEFFPVDLTGECQLATAQRYFSGDMLSYVEKYYETVTEVINKTNADIIGHFNLVAKFNDCGCLFDETAPRYVNAWKKAADVLLESGKPFEVNTSAIARGYRNEPYPSAEMIDYIDEHGGSFIITSDCHNKHFLRCFFDEAERMLAGKRVCDFEKTLLNR